MKKIITILAITALGFTTANAQDIKVGAKAGINISSIGGDGTEDSSSKIGLHLGGVGVYMFSEKFGAQAELLYSSFGAKDEESGSDEFGSFEETEKIKLNYISLPLLGKYLVSNAFSLEAGPRIAFLASAKSEFEFTETEDGETFSDSDTEDISEFVNGVDLGFVLGGTYTLESGLFFSARYSLGLSNIIDEAGSNFSQQNNAFQISVGYFFLND